MFLKTRRMRPGGGLWMPALWAEMECQKEDLPEQFWKATATQRAAMDRLGFLEVRVSRTKPERRLTARVRDFGAITYLSGNQTLIGTLAYTEVQGRGGAVLPVQRTVVAFTAAIPGQGELSASNNRRGFDMSPECEVIRVPSADPVVVHGRLVEELARRGWTPQAFPDRDAIARWYDARVIREFESRVDRGLFIRMSDEEVAEARRTLELPATPEGAARARRSRWAWRTAKYATAWLLALWLVYAFNRAHLGPGGRFDGKTVEYRGQSFKLSKAYESYDDYKDDPNNLDTNEIPRVEQAMLGAKLPSSFANREAFIRATFDLEFPGYGWASLGAGLQADGSSLEAPTVEVPQRDEDRCIVGRGFGGKVTIVDDFVMSTATNQLANVKLVGGKLEYYDHQGKLLREKAL